MGFAQRGNEDMVVKIADKYPELLLEEGSGIDWSGFHFQGHPFRAVLWVGDVEMAQKLIACFAKLNDCLEALKSQFQAHFTLEAKQREAIQLKSLCKAIRKIFNIISKSAVDNECLDALEEYGAQLKPQGIFKAGSHIYGKLYTFSIDHYGLHYDDFGKSWNSPKHVRVRNKVIGQLERYVPSCLAQAMTHHREVIQSGMPLIRTFDLAKHATIPPPSLKDGGRFWFPLLTKQTEETKADGEVLIRGNSAYFILGENYYGAAQDEILSSRYSPPILRDYLKKMQRKIETIISPMPTAIESSQRCVIS